MAFLPGVFHLKLTLVILTIPLGIIGFKKNNKALVALSMLSLLAVLVIALFVMN
jgi:succinate dehydrogenase/fumarate reductase cytochrome b subunit